MIFYIFLGLALTFMGVWSSLVYIPFCLSRECWNGTRGVLEFSMTLCTSLAVSSISLFTLVWGIRTLLIDGFGVSF